MSKKLIYTVFLLLASNLVKADYIFLSNEDYNIGVESVHNLIELDDSEGMIGFLKYNHIGLLKYAAIEFARNGYKELLPMYYEMDERYFNFACAPTGAFRLGIALLESDSKEQLKLKLLEFSNPPYRNNLTAEELYTIKDQEIFNNLVNVNTYGACFTILRMKCDSLNLNESIDLCISTLKNHDTPQKAAGAERLLKKFGKSAFEKVENLRIEILNKLEMPQSGYGIESAILSRCNKILANKDYDSSCIPKFSELKIDSKKKQQIYKVRENPIVSNTHYGNFMNSVLNNWYYVIIGLIILIMVIKLKTPYNKTG